MSLTIAWESACTACTFRAVERSCADGDLPSGTNRNRTISGSGPVRTNPRSPMSLRAPGWYPDPQDPSIGAERWWSGTAWSESGRHTDDLDRAPQDAPSTPVETPSTKRTLRSLLRRR